MGHDKLLSRIREQVQGLAAPPTNPGSSAQIKRSIRQLLRSGQRGTLEQVGAWAREPWQKTFLEEAVIECSVTCRLQSEEEDLEMMLIALPFRFSATPDTSVGRVADDVQALADAFQGRGLAGNDPLVLTGGLLAREELCQDPAVWCHWTWQLASCLLDGRPDMSMPADPLPRSVPEATGWLLALTTQRALTPGRPFKAVHSFSGAGPPLQAKTEVIAGANLRLDKVPGIHTQ